MHITFTFCRRLALYSAFILALLANAACTSPTQNFQQFAKAHLLEPSIITAGDFELQSFSNHNKSSHLNIYLDGDGTPWLRGIRPAPDPTPRSLMTLELLQQDPSAAIYIGRPCYFELGPSQRCNKNLWTQDRYSELIVNTLDKAIDQQLLNHSYKSVQLVGFSGGGALAILLASRRSDIDSVITIAGNLDTDTWTQHHGYLPLTGSLNPAKTPSLTIPSLHLSGGQDQAVPSFIAESYLSQHSGSLWQIPSFHHHCCWQQVWLKALDRAEKMRETRNNIETQTTPL